MIDPEDPGTVDIEQLTTPGKLKTSSHFLTSAAPISELTGQSIKRIWLDETDEFPDADTPASEGVDDR